MKKKTNTAQSRKIADLRRELRSAKQAFKHEREQLWRQREIADEYKKTLMTIVRENTMILEDLRDRIIEILPDYADHIRGVPLRVPIPKFKRPTPQP